MEKVLFSTELNERNLYRIDYLTNKFSKYKDLSDSNILEIGIGNGRFGLLLGDKFKQYFGIDVDEDYIKLAKENIPESAKIFYKIGDAEKIPFRRRFDILFYSQSWHFINNFSKAIKQANRVLKDSGIIAILEPTDKSGGWGDPRLRKDSPEFSEASYQRKLQDLKKGRNAILNQKTFEVLEDEFDSNVNSRFYILKKKQKTLKSPD